MHTSYKKLLVVFLSSLISLSTSCKAQNKANGDTPSYPKDLKQVTQNDHIYKTKEWKNISSFWQKMNNINYKLGTEKLSKIYENIEKEYASTRKSLEQLKVKNYLTKKEYTALSREIDRKYDNVQMNSPMIRCYEASAVNLKQFNLQSDLEKSYKTIEKLFDEGKINTKTFEITKARIERDLNSLHKMEFPKSTDTIDSKTADLIINLNR